MNYSVADELIWGQGAGCEFATGSCGNWIQTQSAKLVVGSTFYI